MMKIIPIHLALMFFCFTGATSLPAQTNFYTRVKGLWFDGQKGAVLDIATQRLARNPDDIAGLLLKAEYELAFLQLDAWTNSMAKAVAVSACIGGSNFAADVPLLKAGFEHLCSLIPQYPPEEYEADKRKATLPGKTMSCDHAIWALQEDGYFKEPQQAVGGDESQHGR